MTLFSEVLSIAIYSVFHFIISAVEILTLCVEKWGYSSYSISDFSNHNPVEQSGKHKHRGLGLVYTDRSKLLYPCSTLTRSKLCPAQSCCSFISMNPALGPHATVALQFPGYLF